MRKLTSRILVMLMVVVLMGSLVPVEALAANVNTIAYNVYAVYLNNELNKVVKKQGPIDVVSEKPSNNVGIYWSSFHPSNVPGINTDGYSFYGWRKDSYELNNYLYKAFTVEDAEGKWTGFGNTRDIYIVLRAKDTKDIILKYDANGGINAPSQESKTVPVGSKAEFTITVNEPTREEYNFLGWARNADAAEPDDALASGKTFTIDTDTTIYAVWQPRTSQTKDITLTYDVNGGSNGPEPEKKTVDANSSATFAISAVEPTRENHKFLGWASDKDAVAPDSDKIAGANLTISESTTIYAIWERNGETPENNKHATVTIIPVALKNDASGYEIIGTSQTKELNCVSTSHGGDNLHLILHRDIHPANINLQLDAAYANYTFSGWDSAGTGEFGLNKTTAPRWGASGLNNSGDSTYAVYGTDTVYMVYIPQKQTHMLIYNANGGDVNTIPTNDTFETTESSHVFTISDKKPSRDGYKFKGWSESAGATIAEIGATIEVSGQKTIYAVWEKEQAKDPDNNPPAGNENGGSSGENGGSDSAPVQPQPALQQSTPAAVVQEVVPVVLPAPMPAEPELDDVPKTGDGATMIYLGYLAAITALAGVAVVLYRKRKSL